MSAHIDPVELARALIGRPSVTPEDAGALDVVARALEPLGFRCRRHSFSDPGTEDVENLYARIGGGGPNFCFAGHTDVVPVGDAAGWSADPFGAEIRDGVLFGRGATDMKGAVAAFCAAASRFLAARGPEFGGAISLLITGDEEGVAINGTRKLLEAVTGEGETLDACLLGEPTNPDALGQMIKIGRRGSLSGQLRVAGTQGHTAYPHLADNPLPRLIAMLAAIQGDTLDDGTAHFQPSNLQITSIDVGNPAFNVIPASGRAKFNIRFNDLHTGASLEAWLRARLDRVGGAYDLDIGVSGEAFLTPPGPFSGLVADCVERVTGMRPELSTTGGTSDARFIKDYCPVVEFGLISESMHKTDEHVALADLRRLADIYEAVLDGFFPA